MIIYTQCRNKTRVSIDRVARYGDTRSVKEIVRYYTCPSIKDAPGHECARFTLIGSA